MSRELTVDDYVRGTGDPASPLVSVGYTISADAHPDVLLRVAGVLNFANQAPWSLSLRTSTSEEVQIEAVLRDINAVLAEMVCRKLMQLTCAIEVQMSPWP